MPSPNEEELGRITHEVLVELRRCFDVMDDFTSNITHKGHAKTLRASLDLADVLIAWRKVKWGKEESA